MKPRTKGIIFVGLIVLALCPVPIQVSPPCTIRVMDSSASPVSGIHVYQSWEHFGTHVSGSDEKFTDTNGVAVFEKCSTWILLFGRILEALPHPNFLAVHSSSGTTTSIEIDCPKGYEVDLDQSGLTALDRSTNHVSFKISDGVYVSVDYSPPDPVSKEDYSARALLRFRKSDPIQFTLVIHKTKEKTP